MRPRQEDAALGVWAICPDCGEHHPAYRLGDFFRPKVANPDTAFVECPTTGNGLAVEVAT